MSWPTTVRKAYNHMAPLWVAGRLSLLLTIIAIILWSCSIIQAEYTVGFYGLIHSFPVTFFLALTILTIASAILWVSRENHRRLLFLQLSFMIIALWLTPLLIGGSDPGLTHGYNLYGYIDFLLQEGHILSPVNINLFHFQWPAASLLGTAIVEISGIDNVDILMVANPLGWLFLFMPPLYLFFRNTLGNENHCWAALWLFYVANWVGEYFLIPQTAGYFLFLFALALVSTIFFSRYLFNRVSLRICVLLTFIGLTIAHLMTSLIGLISIAAFSIAKRINTIHLIIIFAVLIASWTFFQATFTFKQAIPVILERAFSLDLLVQSNIVEPGVSGNASHAAVAFIRILFTAMFIAIAAAGYILGRISKRIHSADTAVFAVGVGIVAVIGVLGASYGPEIIRRTYIFLLPILAYFAVKLLHFKATTVVLCILLIISIPLHIISLYGNEVMDHYSPSQITALHFFHNHTDKGHVTGISGAGAHNKNNYNGIGFSHLLWETDILVYKHNDKVPGGMPHYVAINPRVSAEYEFLRNDPLFIPETEAKLDSSESYNLIYVNPDFSLYIHEEE